MAACELANRNDTVMEEETVRVNANRNKIVNDKKERESLLAKAKSDRHVQVRATMTGCQSSQEAIQQMKGQQDSSVSPVMLKALNGLTGFYKY